MLSWASLRRSAAMETRTRLRIDAETRTRLRIDARYKSLKQACEMAQWATVLLAASLTTGV